MNKQAWIVLIVGLLGLSALVVGIAAWDNSPAPAASEEELSWRDLQQLNYRSGEAPAWLLQKMGRKIRLPGFVVPLETAKSIKEFLLVPNQSYCIHVPAPPPNLMVQVRMQDPIEIQSHGGAVWVEGILSIESQENQYGEAAYKLEGIKTRPYVPPE